MSQDLTSALAEFLAPTVPVSATIGHFKKFNDADMYQVLATGRAVGGPARRIEFDATDPTYNCKPNALEIAIDDSEMDAAGPIDPLPLHQAKTAVVVSTATLSHEDQVLTAVKSGVSAVANRGNWSNNDVDPIDQIDEAIQAISDTCGRLPNRIALGIGAWRKLRGNANCKKRLTGVKATGFTLEDFAGALLNPSIEIKVGVMVKNTAKLPATIKPVNIIGDECFIFYSSQNPTTMDASFAKTFRGARGGITAVGTYRDQQCRSDMLFVDWAVDIQVVATGVVRRYSIT